VWRLCTGTDKPRVTVVLESPLPADGIPSFVYAGDMSRGCSARASLQALESQFGSLARQSHDVTLAEVLGALAREGGNSLRDIFTNPPAATPEEATEFKAIALRLKERAGAKKLAEPAQVKSAWVYFQEAFKAMGVSVFSPAVRCNLAPAELAALRGTRGVNEAWKIVKERDGKVFQHFKDLNTADKLRHKMEVEEKMLREQELSLDDDESSYVVE
jgi:hypothetical protein